ncbi:MAG: hypothetical protein HY674_08570 [Chloroflexi bacterium]|nr:hypothetical protein [Chloroflexota bacterium]
MIWAWGFNALRLGSGLLLLPLLLRLLSVPDLGMYYVFLSLGALVPIIDFGFSLSVERNVSYAMGGAAHLQSIGIQPLPRKSEPNVELLWHLLSAMRFLYRNLALAALVLLVTFGSAVVGLRVEETSSPFRTWMAWFIAVAAAVLELYVGWWNVFLRGMNQVGLSARLAFFAYALKLVLSCGFLLLDGGLLSVPMASFLTSLGQRMLARWHCLRLLGGPGRQTEPDRIRSVIATLWPNTWRLGLQFVTLYLSTSANALICLKEFGLSANAEYGLSIQIMSIIQGIGLVWTWVKFPLIGQLRIENNLAAVRRILWPRVWLQSGTVLFLAVAAISLGPALLEWLDSGKRLMPQFWLSLLAANAFLESQFTMWTTLISTENRIPALWPTVATHLLSLTLVLSLLQCTSLGLGVFVVSPLLAGCLFNYWYWPIQGARSLQSGWLQFMFSRPR